MAEPLRIPWPMWKCHHQLLGGSRRMLAVLLASAAGMVIGFYGLYRFMRNEPLASTAGVALYVLTGAQAFLLLLSGCNAIYRAMLRDYENKMIESHRLTPMTNIAVVLGYLLGATQQMMALSILVLAFGSVLCWIATGKVGDWMIGYVVLLNGALSLWALAIFIGMRQAKPLNLLGFVIGAATIVHVGLLTIPGLAIFSTAVSAFVGLSLMAGGGGQTPAGYLLILVPQAVLTVFWLAAAAAKYRRPDLPALNAARGTVLVCLWLFFGLIGIVAFDALGRSRAIPDFDGELTTVQWVATLGLSLAIALVPLNGSVHCRVLGRRGASLRGWGDRMPDVVVALGLGLLILAASFAMGATVWGKLIDPSQTLEAWAFTGGAVLCAMLSARAALAMAYARTTSPKILVSLFLFIAWAAPPVLDLIITQALRGFPEEIQLGVGFGCSPIGTILLIWSDLPGEPVPGLVVQAVLALSLTVLSYRVNDKLSAGATPAPPDNPAVAT